MQDQIELQNQKISNSIEKIENYLEQLLANQSYIELLENGEEFLKQKKFSDKIFLSILESCFQVSFWERLIQHIENNYENIQQDQTKNKVLEYKINSYINQERFEMAIEAIEQQKKLYKKIGLSSQIQQLQQLEQETRKKIVYQSIEKRKEEALAVVDLFKYSEDQGFYSYQGISVYIISQKWFNQWKRYTFFEQVISDNLGMGGDDEDSDLYPGIIDISDIIQIDNNLLQDPDPVRQNTNQYIQQNLIRNQDYMVLSQPLHKYLSEKYKGQGLRRPIVWSDDDANTTVMELTLKKIEFILITEESQFEWTKQKVNIISKETAKDLKEKFLRSFKKKYSQMKIFQKEKQNIVLWKLNDYQKFEDLKNEIKEHLKQAKSFKLDAKELSDKQTIEDLEIGEEDFILVEIYSQKKLFISQQNVQNLEMCANCGETQKSLSFCGCLAVKYCDKNCQSQHRQAHQTVCISLTKNQQQKQKMIKSFGISKELRMDQIQNQGLNGLQNLGNTCFMNSSLQCLSNIKELTSYMLSNQFVEDINLNNPLGTKGKLACALAELLKEIWGPNQKSISAWPLKKIVQHIAPQFSGFQQQDSQELLSYILDGLHEDLNKVKQKELVENHDFDGSNDKEDSLKAWNNYLKRNKSIVQELMIGQYKSTIVCPDCKRVSVTYDPYQIISVPVQKEVKKINFTIYYIKKDYEKSPIKKEVEISKNKKVSDLFKMVASHFKTNINNLELNIIDHQVKVETLPLDYSVQKLEYEKRLIFIQEIHNTEVDGEDFKLKQQYLKIYLNLYSTSKGDNSQITYPRILLVDVNENYYQIHLKAYKIYRPFIMKYFEINNEIQEKLELQFQEEPSEEDYVKEYTILKESIKYYPFLKMSIQNVENSSAIEPDEKNIFSQIFKVKNLKSKIIDLEVKILLSPSYSQESKNMKFNRCSPEQDDLTEFSQASSGGINLFSCLDLFTQTEILDQGNEWYCSKCKDHKNASKTLQIYKTPKILIIHLKRFQQGHVVNIGSHLYTNGHSKINTFVQFPLEGLDLGQFCLENQQKNKPLLYDLFAVSNHYGNMSGGHYTAYAKNPIKDLWFEFNDSHVSRANMSEIVSSAAYCLFYRLRD